MSSQVDDDFKKGAWTSEEDELLKRLVAAHGPKGWSTIAQEIPGRTGKSCRLRWCNQLDPSVNRQPFTHWEDAVIIRTWQGVSNKWAYISKLLQARTDNSVKNHWNSTLKRKYDAWTESGRQLDDNGFVTGGYTLQQLQDMMPESEIFVPPAAGWGAGGGEDSATCPGSSHSADSMGTPQSHFKARPRGGKRSRDLDSETEDDGEADDFQRRQSPSPSFEELPKHVRQGLAMLYALPDYQREMLKTAARLVPDILDRPRPSAARQLQLHRAVESSGQELGAEEEASPKVAPRHAVRQISLTATAAGAFAPGLVTPASFAARSRLAAGGHLCGRDGYVAVGGLFSPTDAAINLLDASNSPLPLLPNGTPAAKAARQTDVSDAVNAGNASPDAGEQKQEGAEEQAPAKTPAPATALEPRAAADATPIPFMGHLQNDGHGLFDMRHTDTRRTPDWVRAGRTPEALRPLAALGGGSENCGGGGTPSLFKGLSDDVVDMMRNLESPRCPGAAAAETAA